MKVDLRHINTVKKKLKDGTTKTYYYHRRTNRRIEGIPDSKEFFQSYQQACKFEPKNTKTFNDLVCNFFQSQKFLSLSLRTRNDYNKQRPFIVDKWGNLPLEVLKDPRIKSKALLNSEWVKSAALSGSGPGWRNSEVQISWPN